MQHSLLASIHFVYICIRIQKKTYGRDMPTFHGLMQGRRTALGFCMDICPLNKEHRHYVVLSISCSSEEWGPPIHILKGNVFPCFQQRWTRTHYCLPSAARSIQPCSPYESVLCLAMTVQVFCSPLHKQ